MTFPLKMVSNVIVNAPPSAFFPKNNTWTAAHRRVLSFTRCQRNRNQQPLHENKVKIIKGRMREFHAQRCSLEELEIIDALQRLGIDHLFHQEIEETLHRHYYYYTQFCHDQTAVQDGDFLSYHHDLHKVALRFRLLRQSGYNVSADQAFRNFKDGNGMISLEVIDSSDTQGLMSLFEASHLGICGDDDSLLDQAYTFCMQHLLSTIAGMGTYVVGTSTARLLRTLKHPHHKTLARFTANDMLREFQNQKGWKSELAEMAEMEYDLSQNLYQNEIKYVLRWWEELGLAKSLKFVRDQPFRWYMWTLAALPDRSFSELRIQLAKPIFFIYIIDDIFDAYGTLEELSLFTTAVKRWEFDESLPECMKICLKALFDTTADISQSIFLKYGWRPDQSLQKAWADLLHAYLVESKHMSSGYLPTSEVYLKTGTITSGVPLTLIHMLFLLGERNDNTLSNISRKRYKRIISSVGTILRLWNDLGNANDEDQDDKDGWYLQCYMNEHLGGSYNEARAHIADLIWDEWKSINKDCLLLPYEDPLTSSSHNFVRGCLNLARMSPLMYNYDNKHSLPCLQKLMDSLLNQTLILSS